MSLGDVKTPRCGDIIHRKKLFKLLFYTKVHVSRIFFLYNILSDNRLLKDGTFLHTRITIHVCVILKIIFHTTLLFCDIMSFKKNKISINQRWKYFKLISRSSFFGFMDKTCILVYLASIRLSNELFLPKSD